MARRPRPKPKRTKRRGSAGLGKKAAQKHESMQKELQALRKKINLPGNKGQRAQRWQTSPAPKKGRKGKFVPLPKELIGCEPCDPNGEPFCFGFAKGTCSAVQPGQKCPKGWHKCMKKGCFKAHAFVKVHG